MQYPTFYNGKNSRSFLSRLLWELNKLIDVKHWEYCIVHSRHYKNIKCYFYISNVHWPTPPWNYKATPNSACPKLNKPPTSTHPNHFSLLNSLCWLAATPSMQFPKLCSHSSRLSHLWSPIVGNLPLLLQPKLWSPCSWSGWYPLPDLLPPLLPGDLLKIYISFYPQDKTQDLHNLVVAFPARFIFKRSLFFIFSK